MEQNDNSKNSSIEMKKYELIPSDNPQLYRVRALRDFATVTKGEIGGYIEREENLSHDGDAWVFGNAQVSGNARVYGNVRVSGNAHVYGFAQVFGNARVTGNAEVLGDARVYGDACIEDDAKVFDDAQVFDDAHVYDNARVFDDARVFGYARVCGEARVSGDAQVSSVKDYIVFKNWWSSGRFFTWTRSNDMWLVGCFYGTGIQLKEKAYKDSELSGREYARIVEYVDKIKE